MIGGSLGLITGLIVSSRIMGSALESMPRATIRSAPASRYAASSPFPGRAKSPRWGRTCQNA